MTPSGLHGGAGAPVAIAFTREALVPSFLGLAGSAALLSLAAGAQATALGETTPAMLLTAMAWAIPGTLEVSVPIGLAFGVASVAAGWKGSGDLVGLDVSGAGLRAVRHALVAWGVAASAMTAWGTLGVGPWGRRAAFEAVASVPAHAVLAPGSTLSLGSVALYATSAADGWAEDLFFEVGPAFGGARRGRVVSAGAGAALELVDGSIWLEGPVDVRVRWDRAVWPLHEKSSRRGLGEESMAGLAARAANTERLGLDARYEWCVWYKRFFHPMAMVLMPFAAFGAGLRARPLLGVAALALGYALCVRVGDGLVTVLGPVAGAALGPIGVLLASVLPWRR